MTFVFDGWTAAFGLYILGCFLAASHLKVYALMKDKMEKTTTTHNIVRVIIVCMAWPIITVLGMIGLLLFTHSKA